MLGFSPLASLPLGDEAFGDSIGLTLTGITTGSPTLQNATTTPIYNFNLTSITTNQVSIVASSLAVNYNLVPVTVAAQSPTLETASITSTAVLTLNTITAGAPTVTITSLAGNHGLAPVAITTGNSSLGTPTVTLLYPLLGDSVVTNPPTIGVSSLVGIQALGLAAITLGVPTVGTVVFSQGHTLNLLDLNSGVVVLTRPIAFNQPPFDPNYSKKRVALIVSENRSVIVPFTPRKVTQEVRLQNRTTRI